MTLNESLTLLCALIALAISAVSLVRTRKLASEQVELERITAHLSRLQIQNIEEQESLKIKPNFNVALTNLGGADYFIIVNTGPGSAYSVNFELVDSTENPLTSDNLQILPCPEIKPKSRIKLHASFNLNSPIMYQAKVSWRESSGEEHSDIFWVPR